MRKWILMLLALIVAAPAIAQTNPIAPTYRDKTGATKQTTGVMIQNADGTAATPADASAANQTTQIIAADLTNTRLATINTTLGTPLQAGGNIVVTGTLPAFASTPTFNVGTINGIATETTLAAFSAKVPASVGAKTGALSLSVVPNTDTAFPVTDAGGSLTVDCAGAACATAAKQDAMISSLDVLDNVAGVIGSTAPTSANLIGGIYTSSTTPTAPTLGATAAFQFDNSGNLRSGIAIPQSTPGDSGTVVGMTYSRNSNSAASVAPLGILNYVWDGTNTIIQRGTATGVYMQGGQARGATITVNPALMGGRASTTTPTAVTAGQLVDAWFSLSGALVAAGPSTAATGADGTSNSIQTFGDAFGSTLKLQVRPEGFNGTTWDRLPGNTSGALVQPYALTGSRWNYAAAAGGITNTTTAVTVAAAAGGSLRNYVTGMQCSGSTLGAATEFAVRDGAGGTVLWRGYFATTAMSPTSVSFSVPLKGTANTLTEVVTLTASITGAVYCNFQGYTAL